MSTFRPASLFDKVFEGGIILKGISGILEFLGGLLLFFISPERLHTFVSFVTQKELLEDPHDHIANLIVHTTQGFGNSSRTFGIVYLWIHAAIKLTAVIGILKNQLWAYPFSLISLGVLMVYQLYSIFFVQASAGMIILTIFDVFILGLIWREYGKVRLTLKNNKTSSTI
jgi:uncharacterized membrane protein